MTTSDDEEKDIWHVGEERVFPIRSKKEGEDRPVPVYLIKKLWLANKIIITAAMADEAMREMFLEQAKEIREAIDEVLGE